MTSGDSTRFRSHRSRDDPLLLLPPPLAIQARKGIIQNMQSHCKINLNYSNTGVQRWTNILLTLITCPFPELLLCGLFAITASAGPEISWTRLPG